MNERKTIEVDADELHAAVEFINTLKSGGGQIRAKPQPYNNPVAMFGVLVSLLGGAGFIYDAKNTAEEAVTKIELDETVDREVAKLDQKIQNEILPWIREELTEADTKIDGVKTDLTGQIKDNIQDVVHRLERIESLILRIGSNDGPRSGDSQRESIPSRGDDEQLSKLDDNRRRA